MNDLVADRLAPERRRRLAQWVSSASYGSVLVLAALGAADVLAVELGAKTGLVVGVGVATWFAHLFAELLSENVLTDRPLERADLGRAALDGSPIVAATLLPTAALQLSRLEAVSADVAWLLAAFVALLQLAALGLLVGRVAPVRRGGGARFALAITALGALIAVATSRLGH